jgi:hypothetical protein
MTIRLEKTRVTLPNNLKLEKLSTKEKIDNNTTTASFDSMKMHKYIVTHPMQIIACMYII